MISVRAFNSDIEEPLINIGDDFKMEESVDGTLNVSFTCFPGSNNPGYDLLRSESIITVEGYTFSVKQYNDSAFQKSVNATSTFFNLSKTQIYTMFDGDHTLRNHLNFALASTAWNILIDSDIENQVNFIDNLGNENIVSIVNKIKTYHNVEYAILPNSTIRFSKMIGPDNQDQYRYGYNLSDLVLVEDTTNLYTFIRGFGADGLEVSYTSPNSNTFGILEAAPITNDSYTDSVELTKFIANSIVDVPELAIQSDVPELTSKETGERIWLIYEPLGITMQTRILSQTKILRNEELITSSVVFGNATVKSSIDLLVEQTQSINESKEELDDSKQEYRSRFEQTDNNIILQVERIDQSIATIDIKADNINLSVNNRITNEVAAIDIRADQIQSSVSNLDARTSSSITQLSNNINLKIDRGGAITDINLSPGQATINADRINLNGAVLANGSITGTSTINVGTDLYVGNNIYLAQGINSDKSIIFGGVSRIDGDFNNIVVSAPSVRLESNVTVGSSGSSVNFGGNVNFQFADSISGVARANSSGIGISTSGGILYVQVNGTTVGSVNLD